jgi:NitT/TauT family transport system substrate-binding protein
MASIAHRLTLAGPLLAVMLLAACGSGPPPPPNPGGGPAAGSSGSPPGLGGSGGAAAPAAPADPVAAPTGRAAFPAADDAEVKIRASWCAVTGAQFPLWLAKESGILARHRLDADLQFISGSDVNNAAIMRGDVDFVECSGGAMAPAIMAGSDAVYIGSFYGGNFFRLMATPDVRTIADLRGRKMAISRPGDYTNRLSEIMLERAGLVPNQDVTLIPIGNQADQFNALRAGQVDALTINPPFNLSLQNEGFREIYNLRDLGIAGISVSLYANRETLRTRPRLVERFLAAMTETAAYARLNREFTIQVMSTYMNLNDRQALEGAYDTYAPAIAVPPVVPIDALQAVMDENLKVNPNPPIRDAAQIVDNRPLQAVLATGFVDAILAEYPFQPQ